jgi:hypothetical protein
LARTSTCGFRWTDSLSTPGPVIDRARPGCRSGAHRMGEAPPHAGYEAARVESTDGVLRGGGEAMIPDLGPRPPAGWGGNGPPFVGSPRRSARHASGFPPVLGRQAARPPSTADRGSLSPQSTSASDTLARLGVSENRNEGIVPFSLRCLWIWSSAGSLRVPSSPARSSIVEKWLLPAAATRFPGVEPPSRAVLRLQRRSRMIGVAATGIHAPVVFTVSAITGQFRRIAPPPVRARRGSTAVAGPGGHGIHGT